MVYQFSLCCAESRQMISLIIFISDLTGRQIAELYAESTIAVSPSVYEGFGFPAGEAMSCGIPLISTNGGSLPEVVGDAAIVVPHSNPKALKDAIKLLLKSPEKMLEFVKKFKNEGATILGGCCETSPQHIKAFASLK